jgi:putative spermidine/putrescine transport system permease protein
LGAAYAAFFIAPLLMLFAVSFYTDERLTAFGLNQWQRFLGDAFHWKVIGDTLLLGLKTVCATVLLGYPLALVYLTARPFWQRVLLFIVIMPLLTSVVVRTFAWIVILGREGVINRLVLDLGLAAEPLRLLQTEYGLVLSLTQIEMPLLLLPLLAVMARLDPNLMDASASLGASRWRTLFRVILPLSAPGLAAGCLLVFASATTAFISQQVIGGGRLVYLPSMIWQQAMVVSNWPFAATAAVSLLLSVLTVSAVIMAVGRVAEGRVHG